MELAANGDLILGQARILIQNEDELVPRAIEAPVVACTQPKNWRRLWKRLARKFGPMLAMACLATMVARGMPEGQMNHMPMVMGVITSAISNSFKTELGTGTHNFTNGTGNTFKCALFTSSATLNSGTTTYSSTNEVSGTGYSAGGVTITSSTPVLSSSTAIFDFTDAQWTSSSFTANGCQVYNTSASNKSIFVIAFGADQTVSAGTFTIQWPTPDASNAIIRLT